MRKITFLLTFLLLLTIKTKADIIYNDIIDHTVSLNEGNDGTTNIYGIDFDGDGTNEYDFRFDEFRGNWFLHLDLIGDNEAAINNTFDCIDFINGDNISNSTTGWRTSNWDPIIGFDDGYENYLDFVSSNQDTYIAVRFPSGNNYYYGWILVDLDIQGTDKIFTIKSFAYNNTLGEGINAGDTGETAYIQDSIDNISLNVYPNPVTNFLNIKTNNNYIEKVEVFNIIGKSVITSNTGVNLDFSKLPKSIYFVSIKLLNNESPIIQKIIKK